MATFTIKLNAASEYTFYNNAELDICQKVEDFSKTQSLLLCIDLFDISW